MKSIGNKLMIYFSVLLLVICGGFGYFAYNTTSTAVMNEAEKVLPQKAEDVGKLIKTEVGREFTFLEGVASRDRIISAENTIEDKLSILKNAATEEGFLRMGIADLQGNLYLTDTYGQSGQIVDISNREYYKESLNGKRGIMDPTVSVNPDDQGALIIVYSVPIKSKDGIVGALVAIGDGNFLSHITNNISFGEKGYVYMINDEGTTIAHKDEEKVLNGLNIIEESEKNKELVPLAEQVKRMTAKETGFGGYEYNGEGIYVGFAPIEDTKWSVAVTAPKDEILGALPGVQRNIIMMTIVVLLLGVVMAFFIGRSIAKPITLTTAYAEKIADLDIREDIPDKFKGREDEIGRLANAFQLVIDNMRTFIGQVQGSAEQVASASEELKATSEQSAKASEHVAVSAGEVAVNAAEQLNEVLNATSAMEEISASMEEVSSNAQEIYTLSSNVYNQSNLGKEEMNKVISQMNHIGDTTNEVQKSLIDITDSSKKINDIIYVIQGVSEQTNLLALNAAIEAARAGEVGKGFAVVADEVRKLAEETGRATEEIKNLIDKNEENIHRTNRTMDEAAKEVEKGTQVVRDTEKTFKNITDLVDQVTKQIEVIVEAIDQVANGSQEVVVSTNKIEETSKAVAGQIQNVSAATEEQTASMEEIASSSESLSYLAQELQETISKFKI